VARSDNASTNAWDLGGISLRENSIKKNIKRRTFNHLSGRDGVISTLQMTGRVIEHEEALGKAVCLALEDVERAIDLRDEFFCIEIPVAVLPRFEYKTGLSAEAAE
jgi:hypothetical protein